MQSMRVAALGIACAAVMTLAQAAGADVFLKLQTPAPSIAAGDTFFVDAEISFPGASFNAFDLNVRWDTTRVAFVATTPSSAQTGPLVTAACANRFHHFNAYPDSVRASVSLLCNQVFINKVGRIYRLRFRALPGNGPTTFTIGVGTRFFNSGVVLEPLQREALTVMVGGPVSVPAGVAGRFVLEAPRPNPWRSGEPGVIAFSVPRATHVTIDLFDTQGRRVAGTDSDVPAGRSVLRWPLPGLAPGVYGVRMSADGVRVAGARWVRLD